jgi:ABC-type dipeptide/oligopeptide/nickel transport system permease component
LAIKSASGGKGFIGKISKRIFFGYGMASGAFPDFWLALVLVFVFYAVLGWAPSPVGQLDIVLSTPPRVTGVPLVDTLLARDLAAFVSNFLHSILPVFVLAFVYGGGVAKIAIVAAGDVQRSDFINYAKISGLSPTTIDKYVRKAVYPPVATMTAITFAFLLGGAVLVETVFSWGGFGQYAVQSVVNSDFAAIQGVVLVSALISLAIYIVVDLVYFWVDPRIRNLG